MNYYVGNMPVGEYLSHHGIKGMRWGQRRYQNPDGSLTAAGRARYGNYMSRASKARGMASANRVAAGRTKSRIMKSIYGVNDRYYSKRANKLSAKANRVKSVGGRKSTAARKKNWKRAAAIAGGTAALAGAAYLGYRYRKPLASATKRMYRAAPFKARAAAKNAYSAVSNARRATADAARTAGYHARRAGAKATNAARNVGRKAGNAPFFVKRTAQRAGAAAKNAAYKAKSSAQYGAAKAKYAAKNAKNIPGNAKRVAYNLKNNKAYRYAAAARGVQAAGKAAAGAYWYGLSRKAGGSKKGAAAVGAARVIGGRRAALATSVAYGVGKNVSRSYKANRSRKKKKSRR